MHWCQCTVFLTLAWLLCLAELTAADLNESSAELDSQDMPILGVSEASGIISLPASSTENGVDSNGAKPEAVREAEAASSPATVHEHDSSSSSDASDAGKPNLSAWDLLRFTLPTLGIWIINPVLRYATAGEARAFPDIDSFADSMWSHIPCMQ